MVRPLTNRTVPEWMVGIDSHCIRMMAKICSGADQDGEDRNRLFEVSLASRSQKE